MARRKGRLLGLSEIVQRVLVEDEVAHRNERIVLMRDDFGDVEDVKTVLHSIDLRHDLNGQSPFSGVAALDVIEQILCCVVWLGSLKSISLFSGEVLDACFGAEMELYPMYFTLLIDPTVGVR